MADPSSLVDTARAAASALGRLRRSPGKGEAWVEAVCHIVEQERPESYDRLGRRLGFARQLGQLAALTEGEQAAVTTGLFLHSLIGDLREEERSRAAPSWNEYLLRNIDWLAPALEVCRAARSDWDEEDGRPAVVAKVTVVFDRETLEDHKRPLEVMQDLREEPATPAGEEIAAILCTEEGQALCDRHFRRHARNGKLEPAEIRRCIERLRPAVPVPHALAETVAAPMRVSGSLARAAARKDGPREEPAPAAPRATSAAFERRRQALRSTALHDGAPQAAEADQPEEVAQPQRSDIVQPPPRHEPPDESPSPPPREDELRAIGRPPIEGDVSRKRPRADDWEDDMDNIRSITSARAERRDEIEIMERLNDLRSQLRQIQRLAVEGEELLAALAPQLEEFTSMFNHLETMVQRWKGSPDGEAHRAA